VILTPGGKISRYLYGVDFSGRDLRLALVEASQNKIGNVTDQVLLRCFHYDPKNGKYSAAVMNYVRLGGVLTMLGAVGFVGYLARAHRRQVQSGATAGLSSSAGNAVGQTGETG
jgi:protein SCO1/2